MPSLPYRPHYLVIFLGGVSGHKYLVICISNLKFKYITSFLSICLVVVVGRHKTQTEEDIAICECKYDEHDPESACGERCLNVLTSTECTPGYCPCGVYCRNQVNLSLSLVSHLIHKNL